MGPVISGTTKLVALRKNGPIGKTQHRVHTAAPVFSHLQASNANQVPGIGHIMLTTCVRKYTDILKEKFR